MAGTRQSCVFSFSSSILRCFGRIALFLSFAFLMFFAVDSWAGVGGSVSGTVKDISNAVVPNATVKATNIDTGVQQQVATNEQGFYSFPDLPIGRYNIAIERTGFKPYQRTGLTIDVGTKLTVDVTLEIGEESEQVTVSDTGIQVETESTQMGEVIAEHHDHRRPLNGRSYTDLLAIQPGVIPINSQQANSIVMAGVTQHSSFRRLESWQPIRSAASGRRRTVSL